MENMQIYNAGRVTPAEAKKKINGGRINGFTDVNPMWRIQTLTELFGPCGIGWYYEVDREWLEPAETGEVAAFVRINLYIKVDGEWSKPIVGIGGSAFVTNEKSGKRMSDEAFKMATTDAMSVACKCLGFAADVYWEAGATKYSRAAQAAPAQESAPEWVGAIRAAYGEERIKKLCEVNGITRLEDLPTEKVNEIMQYLNSRAKKEA